MSQEPCQPPIKPIHFGENEAPELTERIKQLFDADQMARQADPIDWEQLSSEDIQRRVEISAHLTEGRLNAPASLYCAAFIFQHGNCPEHYQLAHALAERALQAGFDQARWIYAAILDRYLLSVGQPQKYGTQFLIQPDGTRVLQPFDQSTTDEERERYQVPALVKQTLRYM